jgi:predicted secreted protein with PEFG-CTERM motif
VLNTKVAIILVLSLSVGLMGHAYAHKEQIMGNYKVEVGWKEEPPIVGESNAVVVLVSPAPENATEQGNMTEGMTSDHMDNETSKASTEEEGPLENGISGLADKLQVDISVNGKKTFLTLVEDRDIPGQYFGDYTPSETGFPIVHIFGKINDTDIEATYHIEKIEKAGEQGEKTHVSGMSSDGSVHVDIDSSIPKAGEPMSIDVTFTDADGNPIKHINHDITATQDGAIVLSETNAHHHEGKGSHVTDALASDSPVDIQIKILGIGLPDADPTTWTGPKGDVVSLQVVPEFGPIAMIILAMAVVSIIAITAKTKIIPKF